MSTDALAYAAWVRDADVDFSPSLEEYSKIGTTTLISITIDIVTETCHSRLFDGEHNFSQVAITTSVMRSSGISAADDDDTARASDAPGQVVGGLGPRSQPLGDLYFALQTSSDGLSTVAGDDSGACRMRLPIQILASPNHNLLGVSICYPGSSNRNRR